ncbi:hypothetical protein HanXRQr2_Chr08g0349391 [Helianthus annuus]|uniref:Uncharacterized protein n=1 Tax=Helianthus annuus TaxID=4232 RepID=A0A9K3IGU0_HELAN|nr:hypothetical protein HanXRQr2_Chr08g0349391 [Helianthus annuus]
MYQRIFLSWIAPANNLVVDDFFGSTWVGLKEFTDRDGHLTDVFIATYPVLPEDK